jgi:hypothetical protein
MSAFDADRHVSAMNVGACCDLPEPSDELQLPSSIVFESLGWRSNFLLENVYGLAYESKDEGLRYICRLACARAKAHAFG